MLGCAALWHDTVNLQLIYTNGFVSAAGLSVTACVRMQGSSSAGIKASFAHSHSSSTAELQKLLEQKDAQLSAHQLRVSKLESLHRLAQDSALKCEADLASCYEALSTSERKNERLQEELDNSKCVLLGC